MGTSHSASWRATARCQSVTAAAPSAAAARAANDLLSEPVTTGPKAANSYMAGKYIAIAVPRSAGSITSWIVAYTPE